MQTKTNIKEEGKFKYTESGNGEVLVLLHGLFGGLSNFEHLVKHFHNKLNIVVPILPIFELPRKEATIDNLLIYIKEFIAYKGYEKIHILGNSLGGHIGLLYALDCPEKIKSMILTGSSGLYESAFGSGFPRRSSYEYIEKRTQETFFDPKVATKELVDEVFETVNNIDKAMRVITTAKSAIRLNLEDRLHEIAAPTLLIWGVHDRITPFEVGKAFNKHIKNSELVPFDKSGHAPMMEEPEKFNTVLEEFLEKLEVMQK
mgnify:CR=1 FL=1